MSQLFVSHLNGLPCFVRKGMISWLTRGNSPSRSWLDWASQNVYTNGDCGRVTFTSKPTFCFWRPFPSLPYPLPFSLFPFFPIPYSFRRLLRRLFCLGTTFLSYERGLMSRYPDSFASRMPVCIHWYRFLSIACHSHPVDFQRHVPVFFLLLLLKIHTCSFLKSITPTASLEF